MQQSVQSGSDVVLRIFNEKFRKDDRVYLKLSCTLSINKINTPFR